MMLLLANIKTGKYILKDNNGQVLLQDLRVMRNLGGGSGYEYVEG